MFFKKKKKLKYFIVQYEYNPDSPQTSIVLAKCKKEVKKLLFDMFYTDTMNDLTEYHQSYTKLFSITEKEKQTQCRKKAFEILLSIISIEEILYKKGIVYTGMYCC